MFLIINTEIFTIETHIKTKRRLFIKSSLVNIIEMKYKSFIHSESVITCL